MTKTEDQVRNEADKILGFNKVEPGIQQGTGQITTFNQLGFANHELKNHQPTQKIILKMILIGTIWKVSCKLSKKKHTHA